MSKVGPRFVLIGNYFFVSDIIRPVFYLVCPLSVSAKLFIVGLSYYFQEGGAGEIRSIGKAEDSTDGRRVARRSK